MPRFIVLAVLALAVVGFGSSSMAARHGRTRYTPPPPQPPGRPLLPPRAHLGLSGQLPVCQLRAMQGHRIGHGRLLRNKSGLGFPRMATAIKEASPKSKSPRPGRVLIKAASPFELTSASPPNSGATADIPGPALWTPEPDIVIARIDHRRAGHLEGLPRAPDGH
jgi:hypothetical protein